MTVASALTYLHKLYLSFITFLILILMMFMFMNALYII